MPSTLFLRWRWIGAWTLANMLLAWLIASRYVDYIEPSGLTQWAYLGLVFLGHVSLLVWLGALPLFVLAPIVRGRLMWLVGTIWASSLQLLLLLDTLVYDQYRFHLSGFILDLLLNAGGDVFSFSWVAISITLAGILAMLVLQGVLGRMLKKRGTRGASRIAFALTVLALLGVHGWHAWADAFYDQKITAMTRHFPLFYPATAKRFFIEQGWVDAQEVRDHVKLGASSQAGRGLNYPLAPLECRGSESPDNVMLVVVDALRHDMLNPTVMPNLYRYAQSPGWINASEHFSGGNSTKAGVFSLFYGLPVNYWDAFTASQQPPVLLDTLEAQDYRFKVLSSATLVSPAFDRNVFSGLDDVSLKPAEGEPWERDQQITDDWLAWISDREKFDGQSSGQRSGPGNGQRPFFGFLFFDAVHGYSSPPDYPRFTPYWETVNHLALGPDFDAEPYFNRYRTAAHYVDQLLGRVLDDLKARGLLENTAVVITADHGESFNEHGKNYWGHGSNYSREQVEVPLVMHLPGHSGGKIDFRTQHADIAPTLLEEVLGCEAAPARYTLGHNLTQGASAKDWMLSGSYMGYGILLPDRQVDVAPTGRFEVYDYQMQPLDAARPDPSTSQAVLKALSRFYR
ncbi:hypothetical protein SAMN05216571_11521 [Onishia taeanensis]|uniref:Uncharacterized protein n=1 Tax=Onishia taeanensis TaxID=284577 RepID=A0A1G7UKP7_9GAMM|nr:DUF3413 domain-containing protein [Halomonas taeanensis]SDG47791.1 hypothetical protein SAMN05216571_11521 [Halomonas taeanensis]